MYSKGIFYHLFTNCIFAHRNYLNVDILKENVITLAKFITNNNKLPIQTGRWSNIPRNQQICHLCETEIGDEYHYIMKCDFFKQQS